MATWKHDTCGVRPLRSQCGRWLSQMGSTGLDSHDDARAGPRTPPERVPGREAFMPGVEGLLLDMAEAVERTRDATQPCPSKLDLQRLYTAPYSSARPN